MPLSLFINTESSSVRTALRPSTSAKRPNSLEFTFGDQLDLVIQLIKGDGSVDARSGDEGYTCKLAIGDGRGTVLAYLDTFTAGDSEWSGELDLSTEEIRDALGAGNSINAYLEFEITEILTGQKTTLLQAEITLIKAVIDEDLVSPVTLPDAATVTELAAGLAFKVDKEEGKGLSTEDYSTSEKSKLAGIATGATANSSDATLKSRANHTGTQLVNTISDFGDAVAPFGKRGNTLYVDASNGNDATGTRGRVDKPYLTITAGITAATSGDTVIIRPGTYNEYIDAKNGVNMHFHAGAIVTNSDLTHGVLWIDHNVSTRISGQGKFIQTDGGTGYEAEFPAVEIIGAGTVFLQCLGIYHDGSSSTTGAGLYIGAGQLLTSPNQGEKIVELDIGEASSLGYDGVWLAGGNVRITGRIGRAYGGDNAVELESYGSVVLQVDEATHSPVTGIEVIRVVNGSGNSVSFGRVVSPNGRVITIGDGSDFRIHIADGVGATPSALYYASGPVYLSGQISSSASGQGCIEVSILGSANLIMSDLVLIAGASATYSVTGALILSAHNLRINKPISPTTTILGTYSISNAPFGPTAALGTNNTQLATTAYVFAERTNPFTFTNKTITAPVITGIVSGSYTLQNPTITGTVTLPADTRVTFKPGANNAGMNLGSVTSSPAGRIDGDMWLRSDLGIAQLVAGSTTQVILTHTNTQPVSNKTLISPIVTGNLNVTGASFFNSDSTWASGAFGPVVTAPNGSKWRLTVTNAGLFSGIAV